MNGENKLLLGPIADGIVAAIATKSDNGFYWIEKLFQVCLKQNENYKGDDEQKTLEKTDVGPRSLNGLIHPNTHAMYLAFEIFFKYANEGSRLWLKKEQIDQKEYDAKYTSKWKINLRKTLQIAFEYYKHFGPIGKKTPHRDHILFVMFPALYCFRDVDWERNSIQCIDLQSKLSNPDQLSLIKKNFNFQGEIPSELINDICKWFVKFNRQYLITRFAEYVYDQHTAEGRRLGRFEEFWVNHSSVVLNEDTTVSTAKYKEFYNNLKLSAKNTRDKKKKREHGEDDDFNEDDEDDAEKSDSREKKTLKKTKKTL